MADLIDRTNADGMRESAQAARPAMASSGGDSSANASVTTDAACAIADAACIDTHSVVAVYTAHAFSGVPSSAAPHVATNTVRTAVASNCETERSPCDTLRAVVTDAVLDTVRTSTSFQGEPSTANAITTPQAACVTSVADDNASRRNAPDAHAVRTAHFLTTDSMAEDAQRRPRPDSDVLFGPAPAMRTTSVDVNLGTGASCRSLDPAEATATALGDGAVRQLHRA